MDNKLRQRVKQMVFTDVVLPTLSFLDAVMLHYAVTIWATQAHQTSQQCSRSFYASKSAHSQRGSKHRSLKITPIALFPRSAAGVSLEYHCPFGSGRSIYSGAVWEDISAKMNNGKLQTKTKKLTTLLHFSLSDVATLATSMPFKHSLSTRQVTCFGSVFLDISQYFADFSS